MIIESMRSVIAEKIEEAIRRADMEPEEARTNWEAAQLLGLKSSEM